MKLTTSDSTVRFPKERGFAVAVAAVAILVTAGMAHANPEVGVEAPDFTLPASDGSEVTLSGLRGRFVVLEWLNHGCPYVKKHYKAGNMQALQKRYTDKGVAWYSIVSSAPGKQGHGTADEAASEATDKGSQATAVLLDPNGAVGRRYGAKTTPHMFVVGPDGKVLYMGAIDDDPSVFFGDPGDATNYVAAALDAAMAGEAVGTAATKPYGCSVKYAD